MARFKNRRNYGAKSSALATKKDPAMARVDPVTGEKVPRSFVFSREKLPGPLKHLQMDLRKLMLPHTALKLMTRPRCPKELFNNSPLIVLSGFGSGGEHLKLATIMFQNIFPAIDINSVKLSSCQRIVLLNYNVETKLIDFRHNSIRLQPIGVSRRIRKFVQDHKAPNMEKFQDVSDFVTGPGYGSESEADEEAATVNLTSDLGRLNRASTKSAVKLQEIGPRMTLRLVKIEEGLCSGGVIFSEYGKEANDGDDED